MAINDPITTALFWSRVKTGGKRQCWPWTGKTNGRGYGVFREERSHRAAFRLANGDIPSDLVVRHKCDNTLCCNPDHLIIGTQRENIGDAVNRGRIASGEHHGRRKLSAESVNMIRKNPEGLSTRALATQLGVSYHAVYDIRAGRNWTPRGRTSA